MLPQVRIRLELPIDYRDARNHIDIVVTTGGNRLAIEPKYKTRAINVVALGEHFRLKDHAAQDHGRYEFLADLQRLEQARDRKICTNGAAILLTNDSSYWKQPRHARTADGAFRIHQDHQVTGRLSWGPQASPRTKSGREDSIQMQGSYVFGWRDYSSMSADSYGRFRYLMVEVGSNENAD